MQVKMSYYERSLIMFLKKSGRESQHYQLVRELIHSQSRDIGRSTTHRNTMTASMR